nr:Gfo/Idh/MocA family oxidoreductase [Pseudomonadota bacterium]
MAALRTAVVGVGYLGTFHAEKYARLPDSQLIAVADSDLARAGALARRLNVAATADYRTLADRVDAVSIVVPTRLHCEVAEFFLHRGVHVLVEKPITATLEEADRLLEAARRRGCVLQVGHLERFNPAIVALQSILSRPLFIESHRLAPFKPRGTDVNVVLDLMIHDIDIILSIVPSPVQDIRPIGVPVLTDAADIANARLEFANGCVVNVTASRVSNKTERKLRVFQPDAYISLDLQDKTMTVHRKGEAGPDSGLPEIRVDKYGFAAADALYDELHAFLKAVRKGTPPVVSGEDGREALRTALT